MSDFDREVYCLAGLPFDAVNMAQSVGIIREAVRDKSPCFLSTPNLNFLIASQSDPMFRDSVIHSDLSVMDGMPLVWMARLLGIPVPERVAGSSLFDALGKDGGSPLKIYFFGGPDGVAEIACQKLNATSRMRCVGFQSPGFVSVEEMSDHWRIDAINASAPDFVVVALGARKGQEWIERNRSRVHAPVISHLGAVVNFVAGSVARAPVWMQRIGLEWLWRVWQEPVLWRRYWCDGLAFITLFVRSILPYAIWLLLHRAASDGDVGIEWIESEDFCRVNIKGALHSANMEAFRSVLHELSRTGRNCSLDVSQAEYLGPGFFGLLLMLKKHQDARGRTFRVVGASDHIRRFFRWNGTEYLLNEPKSEK